MWAMEGCLDMRKDFHTVIDFINRDFTIWL
jgi:hypothetical protein